MRILVIEDYAPLRGAITAALRTEGWAVELCGDTPDARKALSSEAPYDVIVLDLTLPSGDGLDLVEWIRAQGHAVHILVVTARRAVRTRVRALDLGADDYMTKPFAVIELVARVRALGRRMDGRTINVLTVGPLVISDHDSTASVRELPLELAPREFSVLRFLAARQGEVVSKEQLRRSVYANEITPDSNAIEVCVAGLRKKLASAGCTRMLRTRRGLGYVLEAEGAGVAEGGAE